MVTRGELAQWLECDAALPGDPAKRLGAAEARQALAAAGWGYRRSVACIGVEKGGVGKTFLSINAAAALARHGARVLLVDFDPQCCATNYLLPNDVEADGMPTFLAAGAAAIRPSRLEGLDFVPARPELRKLEREAGASALLGMLDDFVATQTGYDAVLFDVPPFFGLAASCCYMVCDTVVLPVIPDAWSLESISLTMRDVVSACGDSGRKAPEFFILPNKVNPKRRSTNEALQRLHEEYGAILLPFSVHESAAGLNAINDGLDIFARHEAKNLREPIMALAKRICLPIKIQSE